MRRLTLFDRTAVRLRPLVALLLVAAPALAADVLSLASPDGKVELKIALDGGRLTYSAALEKSPVIETSALGIVVDGVNLAEGAETGKAQRYRTNRTYAWHGAYSTAADRSNGARLPVKHGRALYTLEARAYNDGVAFRFIVPGTPGKMRIPDEATKFRLPAGSTVWFHDFEGHYEGAHQSKALSEVKAGEWAAPPLTFKLAVGGYGSITEGALLRYSGMGLQADGDGGFAARLGHAHPDSYPFRLRYKADVERLTHPAAVAGTITTPWRIVMIARDLNALVNCPIVHNVAPPPDPKLFPKGPETSWIKPGRAVWKYLDGGGENTFDNMKEFSRMAGELGFEYNLLEGFWQKWPEEQLRELVEYSKARGVGIILWKHSNQLRTPEARRQFFEICRRTGVAGAKIDFFDHEHKEVVEQYEILLREAAEYKLVVNFHGANKPTGESRTYPNELTREAIKGMEGRRVVRAPLDAALPFTRMLAGHADYTPMVFTERRNDTTWAHQIASAAIYTSPLLVYGANPRGMLDNPAVNVIKSIPSVWDETIVLPGSEIGEAAAFARRRGKTWFVAIMNGLSPRTMDIPLAFLGAGRFDAVLVRDTGQEAAAVKIEEASLDRGGTLRVELQAGGGFAARLAPR